MSDHSLRGIGLFLVIIGFVLWAYGFFYSSFWYANTEVSILEPVRSWFSNTLHWRLSPGVVEEIAGLSTALLGIVLQVRSYYGKRS